MAFCAGDYAYGDRSVEQATFRIVYFDGSSKSSVSNTLISTSGISTSGPQDNPFEISVVIPLYNEEEKSSLTLPAALVSATSARIIVRNSVDQ